MDRTQWTFKDLLLIGMILASLFVAVGGIRAGMEKRVALLSQAGALKVDIDRVRKQISAGTLSPAKAQFYKKFLTR